jgi:hypothetical protein
MVAVLVMSKRFEKRLGTALAPFPPPIFAGTASVLGQDGQSRTKMDGIGATMAKQPLVAWPGWGPCHLGSFEPHWPTRVLLCLILLLQEK